MRSKKDQGNSFFKQQKFAQAVQCYSEYVKNHHDDNSKAYSNMALSCFKLKRYQDCVNACQKAVQLQPEFQKPYYRMYEAYKQLNNYYGMIIAADRFFKVSKQQKQIQSLQKAIIQVKQKLSFKDPKNKQNTENDKLILQIINEDSQNQETKSITKQPQCSLDTKWQRIIQKIKIKKFQGHNAARKFILKDCITQQDKQKYKKLLNKIKYEGIKQNTSTEQNSTNNSESDQQQVPIQELEKFNKQKQELKRKSEKQIKQKPQKQKSDLQNKITENSFKKKKQQPQKQEPSKEPQTNKNSSQIQNSQISSTKQRNKSLQGQLLQKQLNAQQNKNNSQPNNDVQHKQSGQNWQEYVNQNQANRLFSDHIQNKLASANDVFTQFFKCITNTLRSTQLDRYQKMAILSLAPNRVKKFTLIMKSYTGRQKLQLTQLFTENNLHNILQKYFLKK